MCKKIISAIVMIVFILNFSSCGLGERFALDEDLHNIIEYVYKEERAIDGIRYKDDTYYVDELGIFKVTNSLYPSAEDVLISWNGPRLFYIDCFWSNSTDSPLFIY